LGYLYQYWRGLRSETGCQFSNIDTVHLVRAGIIGKLHIIDVADSDPGEFRFKLFGYAVPLGRYEKPRSHPVAVPALSIVYRYPTTDGPSVSLSSGNIYSAHADFFNAWNQAVLTALVNRNLN